MVTNIYKYAAEHKLRFPFRGSISVEDLFDLSLENLDIVFKELNKRVKASNEESLIDTGTMTEADEELAVSVEIVRDVFAQKKAEIELRKRAAARKAERQRIAEIIAKKENESLESLSIDELKALLAEE